MLTVGDFTQGRATISKHLTHFTTAQTQCCIGTIASNQLCGCAGRTCDLRTFARLQLNTMDYTTHWDVTNRKGVAHFDCSGITRLNFVARTQTFGRNDVATLTVGVAHQRNVSGAIWIVFYTLNHCGNAVFITTKIHNTVVLLVPTTDVTGSDTTSVIATA